MPSTLEPDRTATQEGAQGRTATYAWVGYVAVAACNLALLWVVHQLLDWGWPAFLTDEFAGMLPLLTASLLANVAVDLSLLVHDRGRFRVFTEVVTTGFGLAVALRLLEVFPFDFTGYEQDWTGAVRGLLILLIAATGVAMVVLLVKLVAGTGED